jgi:hypothetical protein
LHIDIKDVHNKNEEGSMKTQLSELDRGLSRELSVGSSSTSSVCLRQRDVLSVILDRSVRRW